jgi:predicted RNase H-like HicB family nuclease
MRKLHKKIPVIIEKTRTGYSAYVEHLDVFTTGKDIPTLHENMLEALNLALNDSGYTVTEDNIKLRLDLRQFFQYYKVLNANFLAERIGMNPSLLSQYVRGKKQPSSKQTEKIIQGIQRIGKELSDINLV